MPELGAGGHGDGPSVSAEPPMLAEIDVHDAMLARAETARDRAPRR